MTSSVDGNIAVKVAWNNQNYLNPCVGPVNEEYWRLNHPSCSTGRLDVNFKRGVSVCKGTCWEQSLFRDWRADILYGARVKLAREGKIAIFVTKRPNTDHKSIMGFTIIKKMVFEGGCTTIIGEKDVSLPVDHSICSVRYEDFDSRRWHQNIYRGLSDGVALKILKSVQSCYDNASKVIAQAMRHIA